MGEYISREAVLAQKGDCYDKDGHLLYAVGTGNILRIPAADVVEVVRCRECVFGNMPCAMARYPDYFCADGKRKDRGQDDG